MLQEFLVHPDTGIPDLKFQANLISPPVHLFHGHPDFASLRVNLIALKEKIQQHLLDPRIVALHRYHRSRFSAVHQRLPALPALASTSVISWRHGVQAELAFFDLHLPAFDLVMSRISLIQVEQVHN